MKNKKLLCCLAVICATFTVAEPFWKFWESKNDAEINSAEFSEFAGKLVSPRADLPRGTFVIKDGVVDFAEIEREVALRGLGPKKGSVVKIDAVEARSKNVRIVVREPDKKPDPRGLAIVVKNKHGSADAESILNALFEFPTPEQIARKTAEPVPQISYTGYATESAPPVQPTATELPKPAPTVELSTGMTKRDVHLQLGEPLGREVEFEGDDVVEKWFYEFSDKSSMLIFFRDGVVERIKKF